IVEAWGYKDSPYIQGLAAGAVREYANLYCGSSLIQSYGVHVEPADYHFHGSRGDLVYNCPFHTYLTETFPTKNGGQATLRAQWNWTINS
ncbi:MAG: hypothetical protein ACRDYB_16570, partial [Acidimicrobiales bacterium]